MPTHEPSSACNWPLRLAILIWPMPTWTAGAAHAVAFGRLQLRPGQGRQKRDWYGWLLAGMALFHSIDHRPVELVGGVEARDRLGFTHNHD
jgi:hypothetical protein